MNAVNNNKLDKTKLFVKETQAIQETESRTKL